jgi:uncharacterized membrane protein
MRRLPDGRTANPTEDKASGGGEAGRLSRAVSWVLAGGLAMAVIPLLIGAGLAVAGRADSLSSEWSISDIPRALSALEPSGFLHLGILLLLLTPVARVVALAVGFARRRSWMFFAMSVFVLALLALSAYLGLRG